MLSQTEIEDHDGSIATIQGVSSDELSVVAKLANGKLLQLPISFLVARDSHRYYYPLRFHDLESEDANDFTIPVIEEKPIFDKKLVDTARIKLRKIVTTTPHFKEETLAKTEYSIERIHKDDVLEQPVQMRIEGDLIIIPVQEEILVVQKKILLREEIHVREIRTEIKEKITADLKKEEIKIEKHKLN